MTRQATLTIEGDRNVADILQKMLSFDDLLEACKRVHEYLCLNGDVDWEITKVVEAAIRKATEPTP